MAGPGARWLLLIHQIPPKPNYLRVKIGRRLQRLGAVAIKNSVYVLPRSEQTHEDFQWVLREIVEGGGDASVCEARFVEGLTDEHVESLFHRARDADYEEIGHDAKRVARDLSAAKGRGARRKHVEIEVARLRARFADLMAIDFLGAPAREAADGLISGLESRLRSLSGVELIRPDSPLRMGDYQERTWVTRKNIHVDRMASAWLIRRLIDPHATFKFVAAKSYRPSSGELRFDMFDAEFTHEGDRCTFEVLLERFGLDEPALRALAEVIHDIDLKDAKFERPETPGMDHLITGIAVAHRDDEVRLERSSAVFGDLYEYFRRKPG